MTYSPFRETGEITIAIPALPRPTLEFINEHEAINRPEDDVVIEPMESIKSDTSTTEPVTMKLVTILMPEELVISENTYNERIVAVGSKLGYQHAKWLDDHQDEFPELMALAEEMDFGRIDFPAMVAISDGFYFTAYLFSLDGRWMTDLIYDRGNFDKGCLVATQA